MRQDSIVKHIVTYSTSGTGPNAVNPKEDHYNSDTKIRLKDFPNIPMTLANETHGGMPYENEQKKRVKRQGSRKGDGCRITRFLPGITRSTVVSVYSDFHRVRPLELRGPKALGDIRGVTYIYGMFYRFGLIDVP